MRFYDFFREFYELYVIYGDVDRSNKDMIKEKIDNLLNNTKVDYSGVPEEVKTSAVKLMGYHKEIQENKDMAVLVRLESLIEEETNKIDEIMRTL